MKKLFEDLAMFKEGEYSIGQKQGTQGGGGWVVVDSDGYDVKGPFKSYSQAERAAEKLEKKFEDMNLMEATNKDKGMFIDMLRHAQGVGEGGVELGGDKNHIDGIVYRNEQFILFNYEGETLKKFDDYRDAMNYLDKTYPAWYVVGWLR